MESEPEKRRRLVWDIEKKLIEHDVRPVLFHPRATVRNQPWVKGMMQMVTIDPWSASDRIGFPAYQGNNREIRRSGRAHHRIYVEKTVYLSYFESNSLRNRTGN